MMTSEVKKVPPDGGYGWMVTLAYALNNVVVLPLIAGFGLVLQATSNDSTVSINKAQLTLVITLNHGIGMLLSFFGGPILKRFSYRKVAMTGAVFIFVGLLLTSLSKRFWMFLISYSIICSIGIASVMAAFSLAINSFFKEKRSRAIGIGMSLTGLGAITTPLLMSALIGEYGWSGAVFVLAALCLHSFVGACMLRPAKWYMVPAPVTEEMVPLNSEHKKLANGSLDEPQKDKEFADAVTTQLKSIDLSKKKSASTRSLTSTNSVLARNAISHPDLSRQTSRYENKIKWWESQEINLGSSYDIFDEHRVKYETITEKPKSGFWSKFVEFFDLTLLKDPIFVNILIGIALASCVETNFSLLLPLILSDSMFSFDTNQTAIFMAVVGLSDTLFRFVSPFIGDRIRKSPRFMYGMSLLVIIIIRTVMLYTTTYIGMMFIAFAIGVTKGVRTVYMNVIIPSYVPIERLPFASGIQMFVNGIIQMSVGAALGYIRQALGTYQVPILILNVVTFLTILLWVGEYYLYYVQNKKKAVNTAEV